MSVKVVNSGPGVIEVSVETTPAITVTSPDVSPVEVTAGLQGETGPQGATGPQGPAGSDGADGEGVIAGGLEGQALFKASGTDYDTAWDYVESLYLQVENAEATSLSAGTLVYAFGVSGSNITVKKADASTSSTMPAIGFVLEEITAGSTGEIITSGLFNKTISGLSGISVGDTVYVSETAGEVTTTKPTGTALIQNVGIVLKTNGTNIQKMKVSAIDRVNDIPNLPEGHIWAGDSSGVATATNVAYVDIANSRIGVGTTSPSQSLDVSDTISVGTGGSDTGRLILKSSGGPTVQFTGTGVIDTTTGSTSAGLTFANTAGYEGIQRHISFGVDTAGLISINRSNSSYTGGLKVQQQNSTATNGNEIFVTANNDASVIQSRGFGGTGLGADIAFKIGGNSLNASDTETEAVRITNASATSPHSVGIGTSTPDSKLHIVGSTHAQGVLKSSFGLQTTSADMALLNALNATGFIRFMTTTGGVGTERMRVINNGNVGIGTSAPSEKLHVVGQIKIDDGANPYTFPAADGSANQFLKTDGSGSVGFASITQATGNELENVVEDTAPQLGGDLDVNGNKITSASNGDITIDPNGTGAIILKSDDIQFDGGGTFGGQIKLYESDIVGSNFIGFKAPLSVTSDTTFELPNGDGTGGQALTTNGSAVLSWSSFIGPNSPTVNGTLSIEEGASTSARLALYDLDGSNYVRLDAPDVISSNVTFVLPAADGSADQVLKTDGSGNLSFVDQASGTVDTTGTPADNQLSVFTDTDTIEGDANLTWNGSRLAVVGELAADSVIIDENGLSSVGDFGAGSRILSRIGTNTTGATVGDVYYLSGTWAQADADSVSTASGLLGVTTDASTDNGVLVSGVVKVADKTGFSSSTEGTVLYLDTTAGHVTATAPSATGDVVRVVGYVLDGTNGIIYFDPSKDWIELS